MSDAADREVKDVLAYTTEIRVRYAETDKMGIVYNGNYLTYFEIGRTSLLRSIGLPYSEVERRGYGLPLLEAHVKYMLPARFDDLLQLTTRYADIDGLRLRLSYDLRRDADQIAEGHTLHIFARNDSFRPTRPPAFFTECVRRSAAD